MTRYFYHREDIKLGLGGGGKDKAYLNFRESDRPGKDRSQEQLVCVSFLMSQQLF